MFTGSTTYPGVTITAVMAIATAMLQCGTAGADPSQDDHFLAVLQDKQIPATENTATVVAAGHTVCRKLDDGIPAQDVLDGLTNDAYGMDPRLRDESERLSVSMSRFIAAAVEVYCPGDQSKIVALPASRTWRSDGVATHVLAAASYRAATASGSRTADRPGADTHAALLGAPVDALTTGDASQPKPPKIPPPKVPEAKVPRSPGVVTKPPPRQQPPPQAPPPPQQLPPPPEVQPPPPPEAQPPPPEQPPPPPQQPPQNESPASGPQPGGAAEGGGGNGGESGGGGSPAAPPQTPRPPGMIQLVPW